MVTYSLSHRKQLRHRLSPCNELPAIWQKQGLFWGIGYHSRWGESAGRESLGWSRVQTSELPTSWKDTCLIWGSYIKFTRVDREKNNNKKKNLQKGKCCSGSFSSSVEKPRILVGWVLRRLELIFEQSYQKKLWVFLGKTRIEWKGFIGRNIAELSCSVSTASLGFSHLS